MEAQGDEGMVRHRRKLVVLGTALPAASEAGHSGHLLVPTEKVLPTRLPRSGLVQPKLSGASRVFGRASGGAPTKFAGSPSPARHEGKAAPTHTAYWYGGLSSSQIYHLVRPGGARSSGSCPTKGSIGIWLTSGHYDEQRHVARPHIRISCVKCDRAGHM